MLLVVPCQLGSLKCYLLEDVLDEGVHDLHGALRDASLWMDLLEHSVDVDRESLSSLSLVLLLAVKSLCHCDFLGDCLG